MMLPLVSILSRESIMAIKFATLFLTFPSQNALQFPTKCFAFAYLLRPLLWDLNRNMRPSNKTLCVGQCSRSLGYSLMIAASGKAIIMFVRKRAGLFRGTRWMLDCAGKSLTKLWLLRCSFFIFAWYELNSNLPPSVTNWLRFTASILWVLPYLFHCTPSYEGIMCLC